METTIASTSRQNHLHPGCSTPLPYIPYLRHSHHLSISKIMARHQTWTVTPILKHKRRFHSHYMRKHAARQILSKSTLLHNYYLSAPLSAPHQPKLAWTSLSSTSQSRCILIIRARRHNAFFCILDTFWGHIATKMVKTCASLVNLIDINRSLSWLSVPPN